MLALPTLIWGLNLAAGSRAKKAQRESKLHRLSLALTLVALIFFNAMVWMLGQDGEIDRFDGFALVGLFAFWQCFHVFEVLKENTRKDHGWHPMIFVDVLLILAGSFVTLVSVDGVVSAIMANEGGFFGEGQLGLLTGWLMVLPNAVLAFYYAWKLRGDVVYSSQVGDGHICIPLCIGLFAIFEPMPLPTFFQSGLLFLSAVAVVHLICVVLLRGLPKLVAAGLLAVYGYALFVQIST